MNCCGQRKYVIDRFQAAVPKGSMTNAFTYRNFLLLLLLCSPPSQPPGHITALRPISQLQSQIPVLRPKSQPQGPNPILRLKSHLRGPNVGLKGGIWASRLWYRPGGGEGGQRRRRRRKFLLPYSNLQLPSWPTGHRYHCPLIAFATFLFFLFLSRCLMGFDDLCSHLSGMQIYGSRVAMLCGRFGLRCGRCSRCSRNRNGKQWGREKKKGKEAKKEWKTTGNEIERKQGPI